MALKKDKINALIQRDLSLILQNDIRDRDLKLCTITSVDTTSDLSISKIYVTFFGKDFDQRKGMAALERSRGYIRSLLAKKLTIRKCPELHFILDTSLEYGNHIESILRDLNKNDK